jgi:hypothetical protein
MKTREEFVKDCMDLFSKLDHFYGLSPSHVVDEIAIDISKIIGVSCKEELIDIFTTGDEEHSNSHSASIIDVRTKEELMKSRIECAEDCYKLYLKYNKK